MTITQAPTFCRICEPMCGVIADVEDGRVIKIRSDPDHVHSRGHFCKKASGMIELTYDKDRLLYPMKRTGGPGEFTRISWEQAYTEIAEKLQRIRAQHGPASFATMSGNPPAFSYANLISTTSFANALDVKWRYGVNADDSSAFQGASQILFGSSSLIPKPDIWRTKLLLIVGANPMVSHGSTISEPLIGQAMKSVVDRGGRVIVIDPRRTETAQRFEHVPISASKDVTVIVRPVGPGVYSMSPYPFAEDPAGFSFSGRYIKPLPNGTDTNWRPVLEASPTERQQFKIVAR